MVNPLCILPTLLLIGSTFSKCLERNEITNFGWIPLERPLKLKNPTLCQKIYSKSRACIDQANFQEFLSNIHEIMLEKKTKKYTELHDIIEDLSKKFILLQKKLMFNTSTDIKCSHDGCGHKFILVDANTVRFK